MGIYPWLGTKQDHIITSASRTVTTRLAALAQRCDTAHRQVIAPVIYASTDFVKSENNSFQKRRIL